MWLITKSPKNVMENFIGSMLILSVIIIIIIPIIFISKKVRDTITNTIRNIKLYSIIVKELKKNIKKFLPFILIDILTILLFSFFYYSIFNTSSSWEIERPISIFEALSISIRNHSIIDLRINIAHNISKTKINPKHPVLKVISGFQKIFTLFMHVTVIKEIFKAL